MKLVIPTELCEPREPFRVRDSRAAHAVGGQGERDPAARAGS